MAGLDDLAIKMRYSADFTRCEVSIIIPNWNGKHWLDKCLGSLGKQNFTNFEIIIVDNGSTDGSIEYLNSYHKHVKLVQLMENTGFAFAANQGILASSSNYVALLNNDTEVSPNWLSALVNTLSNAPLDVAAVASKMLQLNKPALVDAAGDSLSWYGLATKNGHGEPAVDFCIQTEIFSPCAGAALYRKSFLDELSGFDNHFFAYLEDIDLGLRGRLAGYRYLFEPGAEVLHKGHGSSILPAKYVSLITRNRLLMLMGNLPIGLLAKNAPKLIYGQVYFFIAYRRPLASLKGYWSFLMSLSHMKKKRKTCRKYALSAAQIDGLLDKNKPKPALLEMLAVGVKKRIGLS